MMSPKRFISEGVDFLQQLYQNRYLIYRLTNRDFNNKYIRNYFGLGWAILDPLAFIVILFFVFNMRFGGRDALGVPYITYLIAGYIAYDFFSYVLHNATNSISEYSWLLTKVNFRVAILPLVKILSGLQMHCIILLIATIIFIIEKITISFYWLQVFYYIFSLCIFLTGIAWFTSSINLFFPDIKNITNILIRILFFLTPLFWHMEGLPKTYATILKINPLFYIVNGYRDSFLYGIAFWKHPSLTIYFWGVTLFLLILGISVFKKLRPHFADVI